MGRHYMRRELDIGRRHTGFRSITPDAFSVSSQAMEGAQALLDCTAAQGDGV